MLSNPAHARAGSISTCDQLDYRAVTKSISRMLNIEFADDRTLRRFDVLLCWVLRLKTPRSPSSSGGIFEDLTASLPGAFLFNTVSLHGNACRYLRLLFWGQVLVSFFFVCCFAIIVYRGPN
jgi:hypothetical protein